MAIEGKVKKPVPTGGSFTQLLHRELFKRAIAWRKSLTKLERFYLERYCAGRDDYCGDRLATNWHRFALKIYLEEVRFEFVASPGSEEIRTLHVKHPALLSVVQKRGDETIVSYENLSSLKDETIIGQVGLDVEEGDFIGVLTLPGTAFGFWVSGCREKRG